MSSACKYARSATMLGDADIGDAVRQLRLLRVLGVAMKRTASSAVSCSSGEADRSGWRPTDGYGHDAFLRPRGLDDAASSTRPPLRRGSVRAARGATRGLGGTRRHRDGYGRRQLLRRVRNRAGGHRSCHPGAAWASGPAMARQFIGARSDGHPYREPNCARRRLRRNGRAPSRAHCSGSARRPGIRVGGHCAFDWRCAARWDATSRARFPST